MPHQTWSYTPSIAAQHIAFLMPAKLTCDNYLVWKELFVPIFENYDMLGLIDGTEPCPPQFLSDASGTKPTIPNSAYAQWVKKDHTCKIWINASLSEAVLLCMVGSTTAYTLWLNLENRVGRISRSHLLQLKAKLQKMKK
ncbi:hypothetical protein DVH24_033311 [Malus domestica]|uniref:Retrotransposon Copia-like N-terminal domain-containing protein n=1 Tax=Malus domestica TaxID=3750 RepID=A0A498JC51_MALDO|nr:hypothetical protein DVH24_033311 [Malus domestica]